MKNFYLFFPQWQGGVNRTPYYGAKLLCNKLNNDFNFAEVNVNLDDNLKVEKKILGYSIVKKQFENAVKLIQQNKPDKIFTLGGECSVDIAPISYVNKKLNNKMALVWFDAHGDINSPSSSKSKRFHGMPIRTLLGQGDKSITKRLFSTLNLNQIFLVGGRDLDPPEKKFIKHKKISQFLSTDEIDSLINAIKSKGFTKIYIHLDFDVLDPQEFPYVECPITKGMPIKTLKELLKELRGNFYLAGAAATEFSLVKNIKTTEAKKIIKILFDKPI